MGWTDSKGRPELKAAWWFGRETTVWRSATITSSGTAPSVRNAPPTTTRNSSEYPANAAPANGDDHT